MKKILFLFCLCFSLSVSGAWIGDEEVIPVEISKGQVEEHNKIRPRTPVSITCSYNDGTLYFTFLEDLGETQITVTPQFLGEVTTYVCDTINGSAIVGVSSASGYYLIEITTEDGTYYYGEYTL